MKEQSETRPTTNHNPTRKEKIIGTVQACTEAFGQGIANTIFVYSHLIRNQTREAQRGKIERDRAEIRQKVEQDRAEIAKILQQQPGKASGK